MHFRPFFYFLHPQDGIGWMAEGEFPQNGEFPSNSSLHFHSQLFNLSFHLFIFSGMKYLIKPLETLCVDFLLKYINRQNVFTILQFCSDCEIDKRLMENCMTLLRDNPRIWWLLSKDESFLKINHKCLMLLLEDDFLKAREIDLFNAVCFCLFFQF